jgi:hypothetical protein
MEVAAPNLLLPLLALPTVQLQIPIFMGKWQRVNAMDAPAV